LFKDGEIAKAVDFAVEQMGPEDGLRVIKSVWQSHKAEINPEMVYDIYIRKGEQLIVEEDIWNAIKFYKRLGDILLEEKKIDKIMEVFRKAINNSIYVAEDLSNWLLSRSLKESAIELCWQAGNDYKERGLYKSARKVFQIAFKTIEYRNLEEKFIQRWSELGKEWEKIAEAELKKSGNTTVIKEEEIYEEDLEDNDDEDEDEDDPQTNPIKQCRMNARECLARSHEYAARLELKAGNYKKAAELAETASKIWISERKAKKALAMSLECQMKDQMELGNFEKAALFGNQAIEIYEKLYWAEEGIGCCEMIIRCWEKVGNIDKVNEAKEKKRIFEWENAAV